MSASEELDQALRALATPDLPPATASRIRLRALQVLEASPPAPLEKWSDSQTESSSPRPARSLEVGASSTGWVDRLERLYALTLEPALLFGFGPAFAVYGLAVAIGSL